MPKHIKSNYMCIKRATLREYLVQTLFMTTDKPEVDKNPWSFLRAVDKVNYLSFSSELSGNTLAFCRLRNYD